MPRTAKNVVEFPVDGVVYRAVFKHEHCDEHDHVVCVLGGAVVQGPKFKGDEHPFEHTNGDGTLTNCIFDQAVKVPLTRVSDVKGDGGKEIIEKLRHITTCDLYVKGGDLVGTGEGRCSVKDRYDWRRGIRESLVNAVTASGINREAIEIFFDELKARADKRCQHVNVMTWQHPTPTKQIHLCIDCDETWVD